MRTNATIFNWLRNARTFCHLVRVRAVVFVVESLLRCGMLSTAGLGRAGVSKVAAKHCIKRIDRLLGNKHLRVEVDEFARWLAHKVLRNSLAPTILVDWTPLCGVFHALTAAVPSEGRALLIYWEVHSEKQVGKAKVQRRFLEKLAQIVPSRCTPVMVTDAGFHSPWFRVVSSLGWDYVGRVRGSVHCSNQDGSWRPVAELHSMAGLKPRDLGWHTVSKTQPRQDRLVIIRGRRKPGPKKKRLVEKQKPGGKKKGTKRGALTLTAQKNKHRKAAVEPWVLSTSLEAPVHIVVSHYKKRMQTEETYRHFKSARYGWAFEHATSKSPHRLRVLLLIVSLAAAFCQAVGQVAEEQKLHHRYQANTVRSRRVLSLLTLGQLVLTDPQRPLHTRVIRTALARLGLAS